MPAVTSRSSDAPSATRPTRLWVPPSNRRAVGSRVSSRLFHSSRWLTRVPPHLEDAQVVAPLGGYVEHADAERTEQQLVGVGHGEVDAPRRQVARHHAQALDGIDDKTASCSRQSCGQSLDVGAPAEAELHPAGRHQARRYGVEGLANASSGTSTGTDRGDAVDDHAAILERQPRVDRRRELAVGYDDPIAFLPVEARGDEAEPFGGVLDERHVVAVAPISWAAVARASSTRSR